MSEKIEEQSNPLDMLKWLIVIVLLAGVVVGNNLYEDFSVLYRALGAVVLVGIAGFIAASTAKGSAFLGFAKDSRIEIRKVVWPTRQEAVQTTLIVLVATFIVSILIYLIDMALVFLISLITGVGA
jgi:preprotein translocase subunit SecE